MVSHLLQRRRQKRRKAEQRLYISSKQITEKNFIVKHIFKSKYLILAWLSHQRLLNTELQQHTLYFSLAWIGPDVMMGAGVNLENLPVHGVINMLIVNFVLVLEHGAVWCFLWQQQQWKVLNGAEALFPQPLRSSHLCNVQIKSHVKITVLLELLQQWQCCHSASKGSRVIQHFARWVPCPVTLPLSGYIQPANC